MLITFAKCCRPIPGDPIIAHVSPGKGLVIHHESCRNIRGYQKEPEKFMAVEWDKETAGIYHRNQGGHVQPSGCPGESYRRDQHRLFQYPKPEYGREKDGRVYSAFIRLTARDRVHLANIMRKIRVMPDVIKVTRNRN